ncbi:2-C-methyl-D-erythritol 4-phosphate cytidylyltransferase [Opitutus terrae]|uniref:2-C-methyl-D-erythritol 4-phosphate cytidylyltransferase n=1 Tax=Opitutus terrae (strain DSM 11246 / JCM 15787 / PB90-1) TaxID=452637 RepID=B1ZRQ2_OPITP|nr:2-C-methyl-D-erythritol 4-phosphate cytidylyltransferase [Opitutus terrae]ACB73745.1 2-C-methyl-D-erythritol 4-phosphate cytidylyltransferase [Opitutus terrae PB90-1]
MKKVTGIILAGGSGNRFEADVPKQFCLLNGSMVIEHAVATFRTSGLFNKIIVALSPEWLDHPRAAIGDVNIAGGNTRNESTWNALQACDPDTDYVIIHDAARPFVTEQILKDCVDALRENDAVDVCIPADDTIVKVADGFVESIPDRSKLMRGQTPQGFRFGALHEAYQANLGRLTATDDVGIFLRSGGRCKVVQGSPFNLKITYPHDLFVAERILQYQPGNPNPQLNLRGKQILLLGATGGIGSVVHELLRTHGAVVTTPTRHEWDLASPTIPPAFLRPWDAVIHSAGVLSNASSAMDVDSLFAVNFRSVVSVTDLARRAMRGGAIVVVGSSSATKGRENIPLYAASKAAVNNFVEGIAPVLARECQVKINCINPGCVNTRMITTSRVTNKDPLDPTEVAELIVAYTQPLDTGQVVNLRKYVPVASRGGARLVRQVA